MHIIVIGATSHARTQSMSCCNTTSRIIHRSGQVTRFCCFLLINLSRRRQARITFVPHHHPYTQLHASAHGRDGAIKITSQTVRPTETEPEISWFHAIRSAIRPIALHRGTAFYDIKLQSSGTCKSSLACSHLTSEGQRVTCQRWKPPHVVCLENTSTCLNVQPHQSITRDTN
jgi:hypothetical protein